MTELVLSVPIEVLSDGTKDMSDLTESKQNLAGLHNPYICHEMPTFRLGRNVRENIKALRAALGSATRELSRDDLALLIVQAGGREVAGSTIRWWEKGTGEPDIRTLKILAELAGVSYERFALGCGDPGSERSELPPPDRYQELTPQDVARAQRAAELERRESKERARNAGGPRRPRRGGKD